MPRIPLIEDLTTEPIPPGCNILVEFDAASQWYTASATIVSEWLRTGGIVSYNVAAQPPENLRFQLNRLELDVEALEKQDKLIIIDWYTVTLGQKSKEKYTWDSLKVHDMSISLAKKAMRLPPAPSWLRIFDNLSTLARFNDEKTWVEFELTRVFPIAPMRKSTAISAIMRGVHSDWVYRMLEGAADGVVDLKLDEAAEEASNLVRVRTMRTVGFDGRWHRLSIGRTFKVTLNNQGIKVPSDSTDKF